MSQLPPKAPAGIMTSVAERRMEWPEISGHRRSASDSLAFMEDVDDHNLLMSIFSDHQITMPHVLMTSSSSSQPSSPSDDHNDDVIKPESLSPTYTTSDPKRVKRIIANRQSAQRSRVRKLQYISELERSVTALQTEVSALSPRVAYLDHQRLILNVDNSAIKQRLAALAQDKIFKDAHQEALKKEIERLRQIAYDQQNTKCGNQQNIRPQLTSMPLNSDDMEY